MSGNDIGRDVSIGQKLKERPWSRAALAGFGGALCIGLLAYLNSLGQAPLLIAPFGASCVLVFGVPASPFARPRNVIGGHFLAALMGLLAVFFLGPGIVGTALGVGLAITVMLITDTTHPPAGAVPIVVALMKPGWFFLITPVLVGACIITMVGFAYARSLKYLRLSETKAEAPKPVSSN